MSTVNETTAAPQAEQPVDWEQRTFDLAKEIYLTQLSQQPGARTAQIQDEAVRKSIRFINTYRKYTK